MEKHPFSFSQLSLLMEEALRRTDSGLAKSVMEKVDAVPVFALPYLTRLRDKEMMEESAIMAWKQKCLTARGLFRAEFFQTRGEEEKEKIEEQVRRDYPHAAYELTWKCGRSRLPRQMRDQWNAINDARSLRWAKHIFSAWDEIRGLFGEKETQELLNRLYNDRRAHFFFFARVGWTRRGCGHYDPTDDRQRVYFFYFQFSGFASAF